MLKTSLQIKIKGHESFIPREGWITKGLYVVNENPTLFSGKESGAGKLGVGTNMAKSIKYWMTAADLIEGNGNRGYRLSLVGKSIYNHDLYLEDKFSLWVIHSNIVRNFANATSWSIFFNEINATYFNKEELFKMLFDNYSDKLSGKAFSERSLRDDCTAILAMYSQNEEKITDPEDKKTSPFSELGLIKHYGTIYEKRRPSIDEINPLLILYIIDNGFKKGDVSDNREYVFIDDIVNGFDMPGKILNMNRIMVNEKLDALANLGYIEVNRTSGLDIVYRTSEIRGADILDQYYKER